jgi:hypothetical protein
MPFQIGNKLAARGGKFGHELHKAITQGDPEKLRRIAEKLLELAEGGDLAAIRELADRLDGKSAQTVYASLEHSVDVGSGESIESRLNALAERRAGGSFADRIDRALAGRVPAIDQARALAESPPIQAAENVQAELNEPPRLPARKAPKMIEHDMLAAYRGHRVEPYYEPDAC